MFSVVIKCFKSLIFKPLYSNHGFYNEHDLDRYYSDKIKHKRFDVTLEQALAWKRIEAGIHT